MRAAHEERLAKPRVLGAFLPLESAFTHLSNTAMSVSERNTDFTMPTQSAYKLVIHWARCPARESSDKLG